MLVYLFFFIYSFFYYSTLGKVHYKQKKLHTNSTQRTPKGSHVSPIALLSIAIPAVKKVPIVSMFNYRLNKNKKVKNEITNSNLLFCYNTLFLEKNMPTRPLPLKIAKAEKNVQLEKNRRQIKCFKESFFFLRIFCMQNNLPSKSNIFQKRKLC